MPQFQVSLCHVAHQRYYNKVDVHVLGYFRFMLIYFYSYWCINYLNICKFVSKLLQCISVGEVCNFISRCVFNLWLTAGVNDVNLHWTGTCPATDAFNVIFDWKLQHVHCISFQTFFVSRYISQGNMYK